MTKPKLTYFDLSSSRGEECRLAFHLAGVEFEDNRVAFGAWPELKPTTPFGVLPVLELQGKPPLAQCNAILTWIGRSYDLHPKDVFEAARHESMMWHAEELRMHVGPLLRITSDAEEKKRVRTELAETYLPTWGALTEKQLGDGPFFGGDKLNVVDIKLYMVVRWFASGGVDHVPSEVFARFPKLTRLYESVRDDARIKAWTEKAK